jgi:phospholipase/lecithinase/hemolysin
MIRDLVFIARLIVLFVLAIPLQGWALPFSNLYVIGDSLSDQGNLFLATSAVAGPANALPASDHYFNGRFSNGPVYTDFLSQRLGIPLTPSLTGGNNFAFGGARTDYNTVETTAGGPLPPGLFPWTLNAEVQAFKNRGVNDPGALYIVFSGANDVTDIVVNGLNPATVIPNTINGILGAVAAFASAGAKTIVVPNLPDLGLTPLFLSSGPAASAAATNLTIQFNALLDAQLDAISGLNIIELDTFNLVRNVVFNPGQFGLSIVTTPCHSGFVAPHPNGDECPNPSEFLFWDIVHPTTNVHTILADAAIAAIPEPSTLALLLLGMLVLASVVNRRFVEQVGKVR